MPEHPPLDEQERKLATVLFADLAGSTALAERLDIEPLEHVMGSFRRVVAEAVQRCGGHAEFVGDGVVAMFGAPVAVENHQGRAVEAADLILEAVDELNEGLTSQLGVSLGVRIGINTGDVLVDPSADLRLGELSADTLNVAARLEQAAAVGEVLASERTVKTLMGRATDDLGPVTVAGRRRPVQTFRIHRRSSKSTPVLERSPALVGRAAELEELTRALTEVTATGHSRLVTIVGEAGIGKSTILSAFIGHLTPTGAPPVAIGACPHFGRAGPFAPLARLLGSLPIDLSSYEDIRSFLGPEGERHAATLARALGFNGNGPGSDAPGQTSQDVAAAWRALVARLTRDQSYVFAVEDVHCADPEVLDLILAGLTAPGRGLLVVATARPEPTPCRDGWPPPDATTIVVGPLTEAETSELTRRIDPDFGQIPGAGARIHSQTDGNPFFVVELVRSIAEHRSVVALQPMEFTDLGVPDSVQGVLADRIDSLSQHDKRVLQAAAVVGREFWPEAIRPLLEHAAVDVDAALHRLIDRKMIERVDTETFRFIHSLTRDVAYGTIPRRTLHGLHESVARWIEAHPLQARGDAASLISFHLSQACRSAEADWSARPEHTLDVKRRWVNWTIEAARRAAAATAYIEAKRLAREAIAEAVDEAQIIEAMECLGNIHFFNYEGDATWKLLTEAADRATAAGTRTPAELATMNTRALQAALRWAGGMSRVPEPAELADRIELVNRLLEPGDSVERIRLLTCIGFWPYATVGMDGTDLIGVESAREAAGAAAAMAERLGRADLRSAALDALASSFIFRGEYEGADAVTGRRLALYDDLADPWERGDLCAMGGWIGFHRARYPEAIEWTTRGIVEFAEYPSIGVHCRTWRGLARLRNGDWDGLIADAEVVEQAFTAGPPAPYMTAALAAAALVQHLRGNEHACDTLVDLLVQFETLDPPGAGELPKARWAEYLAPVVARRGDPRAALELIDGGSRRRRSRLGQLLAARCLVVAEGRCWEQTAQTLEACRAQARERGTPIVVTAAHWLEGSERASQGEWESATSEFERALTSALQQGDAWLTGLGHIGLANALQGISERERSRSHAAAAISVFGELGSTRETLAARTLLARATA